MPQAMRSAARSPLGTALPYDVVGVALERLNDIVIVTEASPVEEPGPRILFVNPAFEKTTGYSSEEVVGRSPRFLVGPGTSKFDLLRIDDALRARLPVRAELVTVAPAAAAAAHPVAVALAAAAAAPAAVAPVD